MEGCAIDQVKFQSVKEQAEIFYSNIKEVHCPYLKSDVFFNAKGLEHLKFKSRNHARLQKDQYVRLRLISLAPEILKLSHTVQGVQEAKSFELEKMHSRWERILRNVTYYEFIAVIRRVRIRVIVKQVENGPKYFWSIIPFWRMDTFTGERKIHNGRPEED